MYGYFLFKNNSFDICSKGKGVGL